MTLEADEFLGKTTRESIEFVRKASLEILKVIMPWVLTKIEGPKSNDSNLHKILKGLGILNS